MMAITHDPHHAFTDAVDGFVFGTHPYVQDKSCIGFCQEMHVSHAIAECTYVTGIIFVDFKLQGLIVHKYNQCCEDCMLTTMQNTSREGNSVGSIEDRQNGFCLLVELS
mgnify:FL=1